MEWVTEIKSSKVQKMIDLVWEFMCYKDWETVGYENKPIPEFITFNDLMPVMDKIIQQKAMFTIAFDGSPNYGISIDKSLVERCTDAEDRCVGIGAQSETFLFSILSSITLYIEWYNNTLHK
jgi:hypothetical protein